MSHYRFSQVIDKVPATIAGTFTCAPGMSAYTPHGRLLAEHARVFAGGQSALKRPFRDEILNFYVFSRLSQVREIVDNWIIEYNEQRPHESLGNLTPEEFALKHVEKSSLALH